MRFFIKISYLGTNYYGWQIQPNQNTIQEQINIALSVILKANINVTGAGRTDTGVHAKIMYAHFDCSVIINRSIIDKINGVLPRDIVVHEIFQVKENIHSRFDAKSRTYTYSIINKKNPFNNFSYLVYKKIDVSAMNKACVFLIGCQDFTSFSKKNTQTYTNDCNIYFAKWHYKEDELIFTIKANRFLRNMVRAIVGTLLQIGEGKRNPNDLQDIIKAKNRNCAGPSVPPFPLFLTDIEYSEDILYKNE